MLRKSRAEDIADLALAKVASRSHAAPLRRVDWVSLVNKAQTRSRTPFTIDDFKRNVGVKPHQFKMIFGKLCKAEDFPCNLREIFADSYSLLNLPNCAPWREYLLTPSEAESLYCSATGRKPSVWRRAVRDGAIPHYQFSAYTKRFRADDIRDYIGIVTID